MHVCVFSTMANETQCLGAADISTSFLKTDANIPGIVVIILFYGLILVTGILAPWVARRRQRRTEHNSRHGRFHAVKLKLLTNWKSKFKRGGAEVTRDDPMKATESSNRNEIENLILAGRDMGVVVGSLTLAGLHLLKVHMCYNWYTCIIKLIEL